MTSSLVGPSLQGLPKRRDIGRIVAISRSRIRSSHMKGAATVQSHPLSSKKHLLSGNGISCSIELAEPHVYLTGFDHDGRGNVAQNTAAVIRGRLILNMQKSAKIKAVVLRFYGKARTDWLKDISRDESQFYEEEKLRYQVLQLYNASYSSEEVGYGAQCNYDLLNKDAKSSKTNLQTIGLPNSITPATADRPDVILSVGNQERLSLRAVQSRSFQKGGSPATIAQQKGYKMFHPGVYEYSFEIPLDQSCPETTNLPMGGVSWMLEAIVERAGTFKPNIYGAKEITIVRVPDHNSLEQAQPMAMSRRWEDQLHYDIVISGKSFSVGSKIPIAFKLTPLAKVQCRQIKVYVTENIDYSCKGKRATREDSQRKFLLLDWNAGKPLAPEYAASDIRILAGGELTGEARDRARMQAQNWRRRCAKHLGTAFEPLPEPTDNLLGDLELGPDNFVTQTEFEIDVQLPTCADMRKVGAKQLHPVTTYKNVQVNHWIEVVMSLSRVDSNEPTGTKRRQFEMPVIFPFHIISCLATQAHTSLPEYCGSNSEAACQAFECGCPNAAAISSSSPASSTGDIPSSAATFTTTVATNADVNAAPTRAIPAEAHLLTTRGFIQRPVHMLRVPSYNPPAFEADVPPPNLETPPPIYDQVVGTPSHDGLDDYFARLAYDCSDDHQSEEDDGQNRTINRTGCVNIPNPR